MLNACPFIFTFFALMKLKSTVNLGSQCKISRSYPNVHYIFSYFIFSYFLALYLYTQST